jgi:hypothetical protein
MSPDRAPAERYFYRSARRSLERGAMVSVYLVERCYGSTVSGWWSKTTGVDPVTSRFSGARSTN